MYTYTYIYIYIYNVCMYFSFIYFFELHVKHALYRTKTIKIHVLEAITNTNEVTALFACIRGMGRISYNCNMYVNNIIAVFLSSYFVRLPHV